MDKIDYKRSLNFYKFQVIKRALDVISCSSGFTPHLEISFLTCFCGTILPDYLKKSYPSQVLIILQHQFYDLKIFNDKFSVSLSFYGKQEQIVVPFFAINKFHDRISGDVLTFDNNLLNSGFTEKDEKERYRYDLSNSRIISIDQLRNQQL